MTSIVIDAMGGDFGCEPIVSGVISALKEREFHAFLVGDKAQIEPLIPTRFKNSITFVQADEVFDMGEGATDALKRKESSIYKAVELVKNG